MNTGNGEISLQDIPDLSGIEDTSQRMEWSDGWYKGTILEQHAFTDKNGNDRVFESTDQPSQAGDSRNIKLQIAVKRTSDGRMLNVSNLINYRPEDLTQETVQAVAAQKEKVDAGEEWGPMFRSFITLTRLAKLQKLAGVRQFQRNGNGGLDLHSLYGKEGYFRLGPDERSGGKYKEVKDMRVDRPTKATVL